jgi:iron complex transport system substrate-binding protein
MIRYLLAASLLLLTACGSGSTTPDAAPQAGSSTAFPVTVEHKYGSTTIKAEPKRIVVAGLTEQDALLALGIVPVATTEWLKKYEGAIGPWATTKLGNAPKPTVLIDQGAPEFERIAAQRPDVIIGVNSGMTQETYDKLSKIAPTVAQLKGQIDYGVSWQDTTKAVGKIVGKAAEADKLVADNEALIAKARKDNPKFENATAVVATMWEGYFVYGPDDGRARFLSALGFKLPEKLQEAIGDKFGASISRERMDLLDQSILVWLATNVAETRATLDKDPLYAGLTVAKDKRDILIEDGSDTGSAVSFITVLSIPYLIEHYVPQLAAAVKG